MASCTAAPLPPRYRYELQPVGPNYNQLGRITTGAPKTGTNYNQQRTLNQSKHWNGLLNGVGNNCGSMLWKVCLVKRSVVIRPNLKQRDTFFAYLFALNDESHKKWWRMWVHHAMFVIEYDDDGWDGRVLSRPPCSFILAPTWFPKESLMLDAVKMM